MDRTILLETPRLRLRRFVPADLDLLVELDSDPLVMRYITGGLPTPRETYEQVILPRWFALYEQTPELVSSRTLEGNRASQRVMQKCGLRFAGTFEYDAQATPTLVVEERRAVKYAITRPEWRASQA